MYSVITPVYRTAQFVPALIAEFSRIAAIIQQRFGMATEFVFVVDACPEDSHRLLEAALPDAPFQSQLILHARNFGSFAAIRTGLRAAKGDFFGIVAADLQEPPEILVSFLENLIGNECDIAVGVRDGRDDPGASRFSANLFWTLYRRWIIREIPEGGVDVFSCNRQVRDELLKLEEAHSSLVGLVFWLGFRRKLVPYSRRKREFGKSAWTLRKKATYMLDSIFAFTDLPIRLMTIGGVLEIIVAVGLGIAVSVLRLMDVIDVPGYAATVAIVAFFGALNMLGLGVVGAYAWRAYENTKRRPLAVIQQFRSFDGGKSQAAGQG